ncbi:MAG: hypothetical protein ACWGQW_23025, partial [bacterium]
MSDDSNVVDLNERIHQKQKAQFANSIADSLGVEIEELAAISGGSLDAIQDSLIDCFERQSMYNAYAEQQKEYERKRGMDPDTCFNAVCPEHVQHEHVHEEQDENDPPGMGHLVPSGRENFCKEGQAQGCIFRLLEY